MKPAFTMLVLLLLAPRRRKNLLLRLLGHDVHPSASVGRVLGLRVRLCLAENCRIGFGNVFRDLMLSMSADSAVGQWNWCSAAIALHARPGWCPELSLGEHAAVTSRHYLDCSAGVTVKRYATLAGQRSQVLTHSIDLIINEQVLRSVSVGEYSFVGTAALLLPGARVGERSVVAAGAVVPSGELPDESLATGVPAKVIGPAAGRYFSRVRGRVE